MQTPERIAQFRPGKNAAPKGRIPSTLWLVVDQLAAGEPLLDERGSFTLEAKVLSPLVVT